MDRARALDIQKVIRTVLLHDWDLIDIGDVSEAQSEYDAYVGEIYRLLLSGASDEELGNHLATIEHQAMGLPSVDRARLDRVVRKLRDVSLDTVGSSIPSDSTVITAVDAAPHALSLAEVVMRVGGKPEEVRVTLERLAVEGHLKMTADPATRAYYARAVQLK